MILVTVGTQLPFDRLVEPVARWARSRGVTDVYFQHGGTTVDLNGFESAAFLSPEQSAKLLDQADVVVAHVGMGTILGCLERGKPIVLLPRKASLGETRNEHQTASARSLEGREGVFIAWEANELDALLDRVDQLKGGKRIGSDASPELIQTTRQFVTRTTGNEQHALPSGGAKRRKRVLAIASKGGHWTELRRIAPALEGCDVLWACTDITMSAEVTSGRFTTVPDANRWQKLRLLWCALRIALLVLKERPDVVVSTGAAPGYFALRVASLIGRRTLWLDSVANAEELSMSGQKAAAFATLALTQWPELGESLPPRATRQRGRIYHAGAVV